METLLLKREATLSTPRFIFTTLCFVLLVVDYYQTDLLPKSSDYLLINSEVSKYMYKSLTGTQNGLFILKLLAELRLGLGFVVV